MRGHRVGVRDSIEMSGCTRSARHATSCHDGGRTWWEFDTGMVGRSGRTQHHAPTEPGRNRLDVGYRSRFEHGTRDIHRQGP